MRRACKRGRLGKRVSTPFCFGQDVELSSITGKLQVEDGVVHLVTKKLWEPRLELKPTTARSRDFLKEVRVEVARIVVYECLASPCKEFGFEGIVAKRKDFV